ncbi:MAG: adenosine kinase [Treponema sp.]|jgi:sugar/nucleoside kinase (ribokinase family)|nr:adenosine kinase [Treponema sp.]
MMNQKTELLCVGNAMVDLFAEVDGEIPASWRLSEPVQHVTSDKLAEILADLPASPLAVSGGGAANAARMAGRLGIPTVFAGAVGPSGDPYAAGFEADLISAGVVPCLIRDTAPTGRCLILKTRGGGQIIAACPGAALSFAAKDVPEDRMREVRAVILDGFLLGRDILVHRVLDLANQWGTPVALDVGSVSRAASRAAEIARYCRDYPLIVFMNEAEAEAFCREDEDLLKRMTARDIFPIIVVKRGKRGAAVFAGGHVYSAPVIAIHAVETTGAGDAFCAGFMAGWIRGKPLAGCAAAGNKAARDSLIRGVRRAEHVKTLSF